MNIDSTVLAAVTKFSHQFQMLTGRTNFFIAKIGRFMCFAAVALDIINYFAHVLPDKTPLWFLILGVFICIDFAFGATICDQADRETREGYDVLPPSVLLLRSYGFFLRGDSWRTLWLALTIFDYGMFIYTHPAPWLLCWIDKTWFSSGVLIFVYFIAVDPRPPIRHKKLVLATETTMNKAQQLKTAKVENNPATDCLQKWCSREYRKRKLTRMVHYWPCRRARRP